MIAVATRRSVPTRLRRHLRLGAVDLSVETDLPDVLEDLDVLYGEFQRASPAPGAITLDAGAIRHAWRPRRYVVCSDGRQLFRAQRRGEVFPFLEWGINARVIATRADYLQLHAATLVRDGRALLLAGDSGTGKSTLAAGLMARGWTYFCDEFALVDPGTLQVHPFPKALCVKSGSFALIGRLGLPLWRRRHYSKHFKGPVGYVRPITPPDHAALVPCPIRYVLFPQYTPDQAPKISPVPRAAAAFELARCTLNRHAFDHRAMLLVCALVRGVAAYQLEAGEIGPTCDAIESLT